MQAAVTTCQTELLEILLNYTSDSSVCMYTVSKKACDAIYLSIIRILIARL